MGWEGGCSVPVPVRCGRRARVYREHRPVCWLPGAPRSWPKRNPALQRQQLCNWTAKEFLLETVGCWEVRLSTAFFFFKKK